MSQKQGGRFLKGLFAAAVGCLSSLSTVLVGSATFSTVTDGQWVNIALWSLLGFGGAYGLSTWQGPKNGNGAKL